MIISKFYCGYGSEARSIKKQVSIIINDDYQNSVQPNISNHNFGEFNADEDKSEDSRLLRLRGGGKLQCLIAALLGRRAEQCRSDIPHSHPLPWVQQAHCFNTPTIILALPEDILIEVAQDALAEQPYLLQLEAGDLPCSPGRQSDPASIRSVSSSRQPSASPASNRRSQRPSPRRPSASPCSGAAKTPSGSPTFSQTSPRSVDPLEPSDPNATYYLDDSNLSPPQKAPCPPCNPPEPGKRPRYDYDLRETFYEYPPFSPPAERPESFGPFRGDFQRLQEEMFDYNTPPKREKKSPCSPKQRLDKLSDLSKSFVSATSELIGSPPEISYGSCEPGEDWRQLIGANFDSTATSASSSGPRGDPYENYYAGEGAIFGGISHASSQSCSPQRGDPYENYYAKQGAIFGGISQSGSGQRGDSTASSCTKKAPRSGLPQQGALQHGSLNLPPSPSRRPPTTSPRKSAPPDVFRDAQRTPCPKGVNRQLNFSQASSAQRSGQSYGGGSGLSGMAPLSPTSSSRYSQQGGLSQSSSPLRGDPYANYQAQQGAIFGGASQSGSTQRSGSCKASCAQDSATFHGGLSKQGSLKGGSLNQPRALNLRSQAAAAHQSAPAQFPAQRTPCSPQQDSFYPNLASTPIRQTSPSRDAYHSGLSRTADSELAAPSPEAYCTPCFLPKLKRW